MALTMDVIAGRVRAARQTAPDDGLRAVIVGDRANAVRRDQPDLVVRIPLAVPEDTGTPCITRDTLPAMTDKVAVRDLRNNGGEILNRVTSGETLTVTRDGEPVAELRPLPRRPLPARLLLERWRALPDVEAAKLRADIDELLDPGL